MSRRGYFEIALFQILILQAGQIPFDSLNCEANRPKLELTDGLQILVPVGRFLEKIEEILGLIASRDFRDSFTVCRRDLHGRSATSRILSFDHFSSRENLQNHVA